MTRRAAVAIIFLVVISAAPAIAQEGMRDFDALDPIIAARAIIACTVVQPLLDRTADTNSRKVREIRSGAAAFCGQIEKSRIVPRTADDNTPHWLGEVAAQALIEQTREQQYREPLTARHRH